MTQPLRLGWKASAEQFGPRRLLDFAILAEELGFDSVMVSDHFTHAQTPRAAHLFWSPSPFGGRVWEGVLTHAQTPRAAHLFWSPSPLGGGSGRGPDTRSDAARGSS